MEMLLLIKWIIASFFLTKGIVFSVVIDVQENSAVNLQCPLNIKYPTWTGPEGLANPLTDGQNITEPGFEWANKQDLKITKALLKHDGNYTCSDDNGSSETIELDVQYFSAWAELTPATSENSTTVLTCWCQSNPRCQIAPHIFSHIDPTRGNQSRDTVTWEKCAPNPNMENRTRCRMIAYLQVTKQDNGRKMSCDFEYKNSTRLTLYPKVKVTFPPTRVTIRTIATVQEKHNLTLNCSTDSSNPVSSLTWRRGSKPQASENAIIHSSYKSYSMDAEYNGENITQAIDIEKEGIQDGEMVFCCAKHNNNPLCAYMAIDKYQISGASFFKGWSTILFVGAALFAV